MPQAPQKSEGLARELIQRAAAQAQNPRAEMRSQLDALNDQRRELMEQMEQLQRRRDQLFAQSHSASSASQKAVLDQRMTEIDARSARIDDQLEKVNDQISATMARLAGSPVVDVPRVVVPSINVPPIEIGRFGGFGGFGQQRGPDMREVGGIMAAEAVILALIGVVFWRMGMKRMRDQFERMFASQSQQLNQLQQAMDVVGVEVERISEGQRFVAKVLSEGQSPSALPARKVEAASPARER